VGHLIDICFIADVIPKSARTKTLKVNKLQHQTSAYIARQYLTALILASGQMDEGKEDKALTGAEIGNMQGVTRILLRVPALEQILWKRRKIDPAKEETNQDSIWYEEQFEKKETKTRRAKTTIRRDMQNQ
jgi:hypothetical protein